MRLQLEIIKRSDDDSIYAWKAPLDRSGLLATWPTAFADSGDVIQLISSEDPTPWVPPLMTSIGLELRMRYERHDPHQDSVDAQHRVHTIHTSISAEDRVRFFLYCGPKSALEPPVTYRGRHGDQRVASILDLRRIGSTWQRTNCRTLDFKEFTMYKPRKMEAYTICYVEQQGL